MPRRIVRGLILLVLLAGFRGSAGPLPGVGFLQAVPFHRPQAKFGGFSALHVAGDGLSFVALSDEGIYVAGEFARNDAGRITAFTTGPVTELLASQGKTLPHAQSDSEGLAVAPDGKSLVAWKHLDELGWQVYDERGRPESAQGSVKSAGKGTAGIVDRNGNFILFQ